MSAAKNINGRQRKYNEDGVPIYRPTRYPFEMVCDDLDDGVYAIQTSCFLNEGYMSASATISARFIADRETGDTTERATHAYLFEDAVSAIEYARKKCGPFHIGEDGNVYPRVLKVRQSCIVEGVAFSATINKVKGGAKLEGVA